MTVQEMILKKKELGCSNEKIAELSGIPVSTVRKIFSGKTKQPRYEAMSALTRFFRELNTSAMSADIQSSYSSLMSRNNKNVSAYSPERAADMLAEPAPAYSLKNEESSGKPGNDKQPGEYTLDDYLALPDDQRVELIDGVFYDMSAPTGFHQIIAGELHAMLREWIRSKKGGCMPFMSPVDVQLDRDNKTIVQPDVLILCDKDKYTPSRIVGAPDFLAEILSPSTRGKDMVLKLNKYRAAGVREYWVIDPENKIVITYLFERDDTCAIHSFRDQIPVGIYNGELVIDFAQIDDVVSEWM